LIEPGHAELSIRRQCELLGLSRSTWHYEPATESAENLRLMRLLDEQYLRRPFYGSRRMQLWLRNQGEQVNRKRVQRLMRKMGLEAIFPKPRTTRRNAKHRIFPYLLRGVEIVRINQVWSTDITYVPLRQGFMHLTAVIDWFSRYVLAWRLWSSAWGPLQPVRGSQQVSDCAPRKVRQLIPGARTAQRRSTLKCAHRCDSKEADVPPSLG